MEQEKLQEAKSMINIDNEKMMQMINENEKEAKKNIEECKKKVQEKNTILKEIEKI